MLLLLFCLYLCVGIVQTWCFFQRQPEALRFSFPVLVIGSFISSVFWLPIALVALFEVVARQKGRSL